MQGRGALGSWWVVVGLAAAFGCTGGGDGDGGGGSGGVGGGSDGEFNEPLDGGPGGAGGGGVDAAAPDPVIAALDRCGLAEHYVVRAVDRTGFECLDGLPFVGAGVRLARAADGARLIYGDRELIVDAVTDDCAVRAATCEADSVQRGDRAELSVELRVEGGQARLAVTPAVYDDYRATPCDTAEVTLAPAAACALAGQYVVEAATLAAGQCSLDYGPATVSLSVREAPDDFGDQGILRWANQDFDVTAVDLDACTAGGQHLSFYNGVSRRATFEATVTGDQIALVIRDGLEGQDDAGNTCVDARFEATGQRRGASEAPDPPACAPLPFICGDGVCDVEAGEGCGDCPGDCRCEGGTFCVYYRRPEVERSLSSCARDCDAAACPDGEKCVTGGSVQAAFIDAPVPSERLICLPVADPQPLGGACADALGCDDALLCGLGLCLPSCDDAGGIDNCRVCFGPPGAIVCQPNCDPAAPEVACGAAPCISEARSRRCLDGECVPPAPTHSCRAEPGPAFGEPCDTGAICAGGLGCVGSGCDGEGVCGDDRCSRPCEDDGDCAAPLPSCRALRAGVQAYCAP